MTPVKPVATVDCAAVVTGGLVAAARQKNCPKQMELSPEESSPSKRHRHLHHRNRSLPTQAPSTQVKVSFSNLLPQCRKNMQLSVKTLMPQ